MGAVERMLEEQSSVDSVVCANCFEDEDIQALIRDYDGDPGCDYCGQSDAPTIEMDELGSFLRSRFSQEYGRAVDQLPYETAEGGYQGWHKDAYDLIFDEQIIPLVRWSDRLGQDLVTLLGDDIWSEWDWLSLNDDKALELSWKSFCDIITFKRHFFFDTFDSRGDDHDHHTPLELLREIGSIADSLGLVQTVAVGAEFMRARPRDAGVHWQGVAQLGPPSAGVAVQFNRMNAPGIPAMYVSDCLELAIAEVRNSRVSVGRWQATRQLRLLNLAHLPSFPGLFSPLDRRERLALRFLHRFAGEITKPVTGDATVKLDYIPTQALTEFLRDFPFRSGSIDGICYPSATGARGSNAVLFVSTKVLLSDKTPLRLVAVDQLGED